MKKFFYCITTIFAIAFIMSSCQDSFGTQNFVFVVETETENDSYKIEYVKRYVNGKEREKVQIDTVGKIFYTHVEIQHSTTGQNIEYLPIIIKRENGNGTIKFSVVEFNGLESPSFEELPESLKKLNNTLSEEDLDWVHKNATYSETLQPTETEKEILINSIL